MPANDDPQRSHSITGSLLPKKTGGAFIQPFINSFCFAFHHRTSLLTWTPYSILSLYCQVFFFAFFPNRWLFKLQSSVLYKHPWITAAVLKHGSVTFGWKKVSNHDCRSLSLQNCAAVLHIWGFIDARAVRGGKICDFLLKAVPCFSCSVDCPRWWPWANDPPRWIEFRAGGAWDIYAKVSCCTTHFFVILQASFALL